MKLTVTAKIKISPSPEQKELLCQTLRAYQLASQFISKLVFDEKVLHQQKLHLLTYRKLRADFQLRSQMAQSVMKTVIARYKSIQGNGHPWTLVRFKRPELDLVWNRDYSMSNQMFSINTLSGRIKVPFESKGMEHYLDGTWAFGTAKLVHKRGKFFLHIPVTQVVNEPSVHDIERIVGVDMGINFIAVSYDSQGTTAFFHGRRIKNQRSKYKRLRKRLQQIGTASARRAIQRIGQRENRYMTDVNHRISKALVDRYGANTLFVVEDLTGIRQVTERVRIRDRYETVSWSFYQLRQMIEYKAIRSGAKVIAANPKYTSQKCPKCEHTNKANRDRKKHLFCCKECGYSSNDDRIGAMNLQRIGMKYIAEVAV
ncbi:transposase [Paenibacillus lautus]|uniref:RNA-guided endonuclease TnpB family protein n=1 Tax=Paenibacillus lautus TaxID=1401 RepID=UPI003D2C5070